MHTCAWMPGAAAAALGAGLYSPLPPPPLAPPALHWYMGFTCLDCNILTPPGSCIPACHLLLYNMDHTYLPGSAYTLCFCWNILLVPRLPPAWTFTRSEHLPCRVGSTCTRFSLGCTTTTASWDYGFLPASFGMARSHRTAYGLLVHVPASCLRLRLYMAHWFFLLCAFFAWASSLHLAHAPATFLLIT